MYLKRHLAIHNGPNEDKRGPIPSLHHVDASWQTRYWRQLTIAPAGLV